MNLRIALFLAAFGLVGYLSYSHMEKKVATLTTDKTSLTQKLADTTTVLNQQRQIIVVLTKRIDVLVKDSLTKLAIIADLKTAKAEAVSLGLAAMRQVSEVVGQVRNSVIALSADKKKEAADRPVSGVGPITPRTSDPSVISDYAVLKGDVTTYQDSIVPKLTTTNSELSVQLKDAKRLNDEKDERNRTDKALILQTKSDLLHEAQTRRFLGKGRKKGVLKIADKL